MASVYYELLYKYYAKYVLITWEHILSRYNIAKLDVYL